MGKKKGKKAASGSAVAHHVAMPRGFRMDPALGYQNLHGLQILKNVDYVSIEQRTKTDSEDRFRQFSYHILDKRAYRLFIVEKVSCCGYYELHLYDHYGDLTLNFVRPHALCNCFAGALVSKPGLDVYKDDGTRLGKIFTKGNCCCAQNFDIEKEARGITLLHVKGSEKCVCLCKRSCKEYKIVSLKKKKKKKTDDDEDDDLKSKKNPVVGKIIREGLGSKENFDFGVHFHNKKISLDTKALLIAAVFLIIYP